MIRLGFWFSLTSKSRLNRRNLKDQCCQGADDDSANDAERVEESTDVSEPVKHAVHRPRVAHDVGADFEIHC